MLHVYYKSNPLNNLTGTNKYMKTLGELEAIRDQKKLQWLDCERTYLKAKDVSDKLEEVIKALEEEYELAKRNVDMYEEDQAELAESKQDLEDDMTLEDLRQSN